MTSPADAPHPFLFIPGPVEVDPELRAIMAMPAIGHRSQGFLDVAIKLCTQLQALFATRAHALFENAPATALMEASIRNLARTRTLHLTNGAFSERWAKISESCGREAHCLAVGWGEAVDPQQLRDHLRRGPAYEVVTITHCETSTGVLSPLRDLSQVVRETQPDALVVADVVTSLAGAELRVDDWGIDCAFAGTQKCLALPPGLVVYTVSERAMSRARTMPGRGWLLDFVRAAEGLGKGETVATPCVPLVYALAHQLGRIEREGLPARWQRHAAMRSLTETWCQRRGFELFVASGLRSPTVSTIKASGRVVKDLIASAKAKGYTLGNGYGKLRDVTFRIGHMGDHTPERVAGLLGALADA